MFGEVARNRSIPLELNGTELRITDRPTLNSLHNLVVAGPTHWLISASINGIQLSFDHRGYPQMLPDPYFPREILDLEAEAGFFLEIGIANALCCQVSGAETIRSKILAPF